MAPGATDPRLGMPVPTDVAFKAPTTVGVPVNEVCMAEVAKLRSGGADGDPVARAAILPGSANVNGSQHSMLSISM